MVVSDLCIAGQSVGVVEVDRHEKRWAIPIVESGSETGRKRRDEMLVRLDVDSTVNLFDHSHVAAAKD